MGKNNLYIAKRVLLFGTLFTLPMYTIINNILLGLYIVLCLFDGDFKGKWNRIQKNFIWATPVLVLFLLAVVASTINYSGHFFRHIEKYWSFLLLPIVFLSQDNFYSKHKKLIFKGLLSGCVFALVICYINVFYEMLSNSEPFSYFFRWRHINHRFTEIVDTHPAYLGLFIITSVIYLFFENKLNSTLKIGIFLFFSLAMFQLASRMAMGIYVLIMVILLIIKYKKKGVLILMVLALIGTVFVFKASEYLKGRMFSSEVLVEDKRFGRLIPSYEIFKDHPVVGIGFSKIDEARKQKYAEHGFEVALKNNFNAHNQFIEYLSINGLIGGLVYLMVFIFLIYKSINRKDYMYTMIFTVLFIANITESMFVRIKGIEYFSIFAMLFLSQLIEKRIN